jgi:hypothetical protein
MSIDIYGKKPDSTPIVLRYTHPSSLNLANVNACALLRLLGLPFEQGYGEASVVDVRRAVIKAKALFEKKADAFTQEPVDEGNYHFGGIRKDYLRMRLDDLSSTVETLAGMGATIVYWC